MLQITSGDILAADTEALVNTVNCVGVMGRGIALQFRKAYPENNAVYEQACKQGALRPGIMLVHDLGTFTNPRYIINFPTKRHWKDKSRLADIELGLEALIAEVRRRDIRSIAIPPLGCGLGGLDWAEVRPRIETAFAPLNTVQVLIYEPAGAPAAEVMAATEEIPAMTVGRAALIVLMRQYLGAAMDPFISLLEIHKLMYFMQEMGERLTLNYKPALYGPYAENLRHVLSRIEQHYITGYADGDDDPEKQIEILPGADVAAEQFLRNHPETAARFERVAALIQGFETSYGMELLSTVHWVAARNGASTPEIAVEQVHGWNKRKNALFPADSIVRAWTTLQHRGALPVGIGTKNS
jgi:O-acetyl-ADP-ribose deacetylase (regulator of RNase III)